MYIEDQIGGFCEVHHGDHNGSIVIRSTIWIADTIRKLLLKFGSSTIKTVGGDRFNSKQFFYYIEDQIGGFCEVHHGDHNGSIVTRSTIWIIRKLLLKFESSTTKTVG